MKENLTELVLILDRSGSMSSIRDDAMGSVNSFLDDQKKVEGSANVTLCQFDDEFDIIHDCVDLQNVPSLTPETFVPRGSTALFDAIGRTVNQVGARLGSTDEKDRPSNVIVAIITDGGENASKEFTKSQIFEMVTEQESKYNWEFIYLSSDIKASQDAVSYGFKSKSIAVMDTGGEAYRGGTMSVSSYVSETRMVGKDANSYTLQNLVDGAVVEKRISDSVLPNTTASGTITDSSGTPD